MTQGPLPKPPAATAPRAGAGVLGVSSVLPLLSTGVIVGVLTVVLSTSTATMVWSGELSAFLPNGIGLALLSTALVGTVFTLAGSLPGTAAFSQLAPGAIMAVMAASVAVAMPSDATPITTFMTVVALIGLTTMLSGLTFLSVGIFRLGRLVRYLPYPVVGGFIAGTGWLLLTGGIRVMSDVAPSLSYVTDLFAPGTPVRWLPGLALALLVVLVTGRARHPLAFPALIAAATAGFYATLWASGGSIDAWRDGGLLLGPFPDVDLLRPLQPNDLQHVDWGIVVSHAAAGGSVLFMSLMAILFNATALEAAVGVKVDLNRELRAAGLGNLLAGSFGGTIGYQALSLTMLNHRLGSGRRLTPVVSVAVVVFTMVQGADLLALVPTLVVGGVLSYLGITFLLQWVHGAYSTLTRLEYAVVLAILASIVAFGFLPGVGIGLVLAVALFVVNYSRVDIVRHALTGATARSRVSWNAHDRALIEAQGERVSVLQLQGFLFFGSVNGLAERLERSLGGAAAIRHVIIDFRHVSGMDSTASTSFLALARLASSARFSLILSGLSPILARQLARAGFIDAPDDDPAILIVPTLDDALEWSERHRLDAAPGESQPTSAHADDQAFRLLIPHLERIELPAGEAFILQGQRADDLYLVVSGQVTARLETDEGASLRLETMQGDNLVGEIGFYTGSPRGATVVADEDTVVYRLTREALAALDEHDPPLAAAVHRLVARRLAARVTHLQGVVAALGR